MLVAGALSAVYSFIYVTGPVGYLGEFFNRQTNPYTPLFKGAQLYLDIQDFNSAIFYLSIAMIVLAAFLFITATSKRRKYYISNYVATGVCAGFDIVASIVIMALNGTYRARFVNETDFATWAQLNETNRLANNMSNAYSESTAMFDVGFVIYILVIAAAALLIFNLFWKLSCEKKEKSLLAKAQLDGGVA